MLSKSIYVKSVTNLSDARYCAGMGVEYLGVCIDEGAENFLPLAAFAEIRNWLVGVNWIAETKLQDSAEIMELLTQYDLNTVAVRDAEVIHALQANNIETIQVSDFIEFSSQPASNISIIWVPDGEVDNFTRTNAANLSNCYIESDFSHETMQKLANLPDLKGVVLSGGKEDRPGFKNMDELIDSIELFETD